MPESEQGSAQEDIWFVLKIAQQGPAGSVRRKVTGDRLLGKGALARPRHLSVGQPSSRQLFPGPPVPFLAMKACQLLHAVAPVHCQEQCWQVAVAASYSPSAQSMQLPWIPWYAKKAQHHISSGTSSRRAWWDPDRVRCCTADMIGYWKHGSQTVPVCTNLMPSMVKGPVSPS